MTVNTIFIIILIILISDFILERMLSVLNIKASKQPIPSLLSGIYDNEKYQKQQAYFQANSRFGLITSTFSFIILMLMISLSGFGWLDGIVQGITEKPILVSLLFFGILFFANDLISIPFEIYDTFVIEERFGFNKTTPKTFILDKLKGYLLTILLGGGLLSLIMWIYQLNPEYFWLIAWVVMSVFGLFMNMFYSELIVPLFNKQTPLEEGELRDAIEKFSAKANFSIKNIYVIDGSKRSTKANAYFTGFGKKKRIVLYDTLINQLTVDEIVAVLAHEVGHNKKKHTLKNMLISLIYNLLLFFLLGLFLKSDVLAQALGGVEANFHLNLLAFGILYSPISMVLGLLMNVLSRKHEYEADFFVKTNDFGAELISALKKISGQALSNLTPHPAVVFLSYSHPTLLQRVERLVE
ncbi:MAG TPA: M48 family metallopeptidase [Bacteroidales bacterium]|nr:M48 family metallopeptidase [Bacteroidales bacterium]